MGKGQLQTSVEQVVDADRRTFATALLSRLPKFAGGPRDNFTTFLREFELITKAMNISMREKCSVLSTCLTGYAASEYGEISELYRENYFRLVNELKQ